MVTKKFEYKNFQWEEIPCLEAGVVIASEDFVSTHKDGVTKKEYFSYGEALRHIEYDGLDKFGWRLPTRAEWLRIALAYGENEDGEIDGEAIRRALNFSQKGFRMGAINYDHDRTTRYWTSTPMNEGCREQQYTIKVTNNGVAELMSSRYSAEADPELEEKIPVRLVRSMTEEEKKDSSLRSE